MFAGQRGRERRARPRRSSRRRRTPARRGGWRCSGPAIELAASSADGARLGRLAEPYREGRRGRYASAAKALTAAGAGVLALAGRAPGGAVAGGALLLAGGALERWAVFRAGFASARDPSYTVGPQRARLDDAPRR